MYFDFSDQQQQDQFIKILSKMTRNRKDAWDLFQDICEYMVIHPEKNLFFGQVQGFAKNRYRNQIKKARKTAFSIDTLEGSIQIEEVLLKRCNLIETDLEVKEKIQKLLCQIEKLPDKDCKLFKLRYFNDLTFNEIALRTRKPVGTIKSSIHRSLQKIQKQTEEE